MGKPLRAVDVSVAGRKLEECMDFYNVYGTQEFNEKQVADFCRMKGLV